MRLCEWLLITECFEKLFSCEVSCMHAVHVSHFYTLFYLGFRDAAPAESLDLDDSRDVILE